MAGRSGRTDWTIVLWGVLALGVVTSRPANAAPVGKGVGKIECPVTPGADCCALLIPDTALFIVAGTPIDLGSVGTLLSNDIQLSGATYHATGHATPSSVFSFDTAGSFLYQCQSPFCLGTPNSFLGDIDNLSGSFTLSPGLSYTLDGGYSGPNITLPSNDIPTCNLLSSVVVFSGRFEVNAFQGVPTLPGSDVSATTNTTFIDGATGNEVPVSIDATFAHVSAAGETLVKAFSAAAVEVPDNFAAQVNGTCAVDSGISCCADADCPSGSCNGCYRAAFADVTTTASVTGPIDICSHYPDADDDGIVDGTNVDEGRLHVLHEEAGVFVDRTFLVDHVANRICARVSSLSFFIVAVNLANDRFVSTTGSDSANACTSSASPCRTLFHAIGQAGSGDTIKIAAGTYTEHLDVFSSTNLTLSGGWSADFSARNPSTTVTIVAGSPFFRHLFEAGLGHSLSITLDGLTMTGPGMDARAHDGGVLDLTVANCAFTKNTNPIAAPPTTPQLDPNADGGALLAIAAGTSSLSLAVTNSVFSKNVAVSGGAVSLKTSDASSLSGAFVGTTFTKNKSVRGGLAGALDVHALDNSHLGVIITGSSFTGNSTKDKFGSNGRGGALRAVASSAAQLDVSITGTTFSKNKATSGGAMVVDSFTSSGGFVHLTVGDSTVAHNKSTLPGGGVRLQAGSSSSSGTVQADFRNSIFSQNSTPSRLGVHIEANALTTGTLQLGLTDCTVTQGKGSGLRVRSTDSSSNAAATVANSIVWGNTTDVEITQTAGVAQVSADHSDIGPVMSSGTYSDLGGNIDADPRFVTPTDLHLKAVSPCIDAGNCATSATTDIDGDARPSGAGCDIGADEFVP